MKYMYSIIDGRSTTKNLPFTYLTNPVKILLYNCRKTNYN